MQAAVASSRAGARPLGLEHREMVVRGLQRCYRPPDANALSDLTFSNLYLFRAAHQYHYVPGEYPCVAGRTYDGAAYLLPLFDLASTPPRRLLELLGRDECYYPLPAEVASILSRAGFTSVALREDCDYVFAASELADYATRPLRGQRTAVRKLRAQHAVEERDIRHDGGRDAQYILDNWCVERSFGTADADAAPCREAICPPEGLSALGGKVYYVDGQPAGFVLTEPLNRVMHAVRFAKGLSAYPGIYPHMFQSICRGRADELEWLNFEQDLGKPGFRRAKLSYAPARLLEKFRASPA